MLFKRVVGLWVNVGNHVSANLILQQPSYTILADEQPSDLTKSLARFRNSESIGIVDYAENKEQGKKVLKDITIDQAEGKYVNLPWKETQPLQTSSFELCVSRLHHLSSCLNKDGLLNEYVNVFKEQGRAEIIERVSVEEAINKDAHFKKPRRSYGSYLAD